MNVEQDMSAANGGGSMTTSISYSFGRTISELFDVMNNDMARLGVVLSSAPVDPVDTVRAISQDFDAAESFYNTLFFARQQLVNKKASVDLREIVGMVKPDEEAYAEEYELEDIYINGDFKAKDVTYLAPPNPGERTAPTTNLDPTRDIEAKKGFEPHFANGITALHYVSRPICTLEQYIAFIHGGESIESLSEPRDLVDTATGAVYTRPAQVEGPRHDYSYLELMGAAANAEVRSSAIFYERIRALRPGPGTRPPAAQIGADVTAVAGSTVSQAVPETQNVAGVPADFPQTRYDWDTLLLTYRKQILERQSPLR